MCKLDELEELITFIEKCPLHGLLVNKEPEELVLWLKFVECLYTKTAQLLGYSYKSPAELHNIHSPSSTTPGNILISARKREEYEEYVSVYMPCDFEGVYSILKSNFSSYKNFTYQSLYYHSICLEYYVDTVYDNPSSNMQLFAQAVCNIIMLIGKNKALDVVNTYLSHNYENQSEDITALFLEQYASSIDESQQIYEKLRDIDDYHTISIFAMKDAGCKKFIDALDELCQLSYSKQFTDGQSNRSAFGNDMLKMACLKMLREGFNACYDDSQELEFYIDVLSSSKLYAIQNNNLFENKGKEQLPVEALLNRCLYLLDGMISCDTTAMSIFDTISGYDTESTSNELSISVAAGYDYAFDREFTYDNVCWMFPMLLMILDYLIENYSGTSA